MSEDKSTGNVFISTGITGAQGPGARVDSMTVIQQSGNLPPLSEQEILILKELADQLVRSLPAGLEVSEAVAGYEKLNEIVRAVETKDPQQQQQAISGWKNWLNSIGGKAQTVVNFAANLVTIAGPWMKALGLS